ALRRLLGHAPRGGRPLPAFHGTRGGGRCRHSLPGAGRLELAAAVATDAGAQWPGAPNGRAAEAAGPAAGFGLLGPAGGWLGFPRLELRSPPLRSLVRGAASSTGLGVPAAAADAAEAPRG
ncbi:unnamed protein product, partial [Effrenium voratum]